MAGNFQIVVLSRQKNSSVHLRDFTDFFNTDVFSFPMANACLLCWWHKECGVVLAPCIAVCLERRKHNAFDIVDEIFENLNSISNIFQEPLDFLIFTGSVTIYISLRSSQPKVPTDAFLVRGTFILKITEMEFGILIKHFWGPLFVVFTTRRCSTKKMFLKISQYSQKAVVPESLLKLQLY